MSADERIAESEAEIRQLLEGAEQFRLMPDAEAAVTALNSIHAMVDLGGTMAVLHEAQDDAGRTVARFMRVPEFLNKYRNRWCKVMPALKDEIKWYPWGQVWLGAAERRDYAGVTFAPGGNVPHGFYNFWRGFDVTPDPAAGSCALFKEHLYENVCGGNAALYDWVFGWFAHLVQKPEERLGVALVLRGHQGAGKSKIGEVVGSLFSQHYHQIDDPRYLTGHFNAHMKACLLLQADEGFWAGDKSAEGRLKGLVTSSHHFIEAKGLDATPVRNLVHLLVTSNNDWVVPAGFGERRFAVVDVGDGRLQDHAFFAAIDAEMDNGGRARLLHELQTFDLSRVDLRHIPQTRALMEQKLESLAATDSWWFDCLARGSIKVGGETWETEISMDDIVVSYGKAMDAMNVRFRALRTKLGMALHRRLCPGVVARRLTVARWEADAYGGGHTVTRRPHGFVLPPLAECRTAFEALLGGEVPWNELGPDTEAGASAPAAGGQESDL